MTDVFEIADILVEHTRRVHGDNVALVAYYGSHAKGTASPTSDLDLFYIPDKGKASSLCTQFVLENLPYDFWPVSWQTADDIANAVSHRPWAVSASLIADAKVLTYRSAEDLGRFEALQERIAELTRPESREYMVRRALAEHEALLAGLAQHRLASTSGSSADLVWSGWQYAARVLNCLALVNQTYFSKGWGWNLRQILEMELRPPGIEESLRAIVTPSDPADAAAAAHQLAQDVRSILLAAQLSLARPAAPAEVFADFYYYVVEFRAKTIAACDRHDAMAASSAAIHLQELICRLLNKVNVGFVGTSVNLMSEYDSGYRALGLPDLAGPAASGDFAELAARTHELHDRLREWFESNEIALNVLGASADVQQLLDSKADAQVE